MSKQRSQHLDLLAFGAHPDDVELSCGGTLAKMVKIGHRTGIIDLTRGEMGTRGGPELRMKEASAAAKILGVSVRENLCLPDGNIPVNVPTELIEAIRRYRPSIVLLPYHEDRHPDHVRASRLLTEACFQAGLEKFATALPPHRPNWLLYYMQHTEFQPSFVVDIEGYFKKKIKAIKSYRSQIHSPGYKKKQKEKETLISSPQFFTLIETRGRYYGSLIGVSYGEPFWMRTMVGISDPVEFFCKQDNFRTQ